MELLCIQTHSQGAVIAGNVYPLISDKCPCQCEAYDVGIPISKSPDYRGTGAKICAACGITFKEDGIWWMAKILFATIATQEEMESLNKQEVITHNNER